MEFTYAVSLLMFIKNSSDWFCVKFADAVKLIDASPVSVMNVKLAVLVLLIVAFSAFVSTNGFLTFVNVALFT